MFKKNKAHMFSLKDTEQIRKIANNVDVLATNGPIHPYPATRHRLRAATMLRAQTPQHLSRLTSKQCENCRSIWRIPNMVALQME